MPNAQASDLIALLMLTNVNIKTLIEKEKLSQDNVIDLAHMNYHFLEAIATPGACSLIRDYDVSLERMASIFDESPDKLKAVSSLDTIRLISDHNMSFEDINSVYDTSPAALWVLSAERSRHFMKTSNIDPDAIVKLYGSNPQTLQAFVEGAKGSIGEKEIEVMIAEQDSTRTLWSIYMEQVATSTDGGYVEALTRESGSISASRV